MKRTLGSQKGFTLIELVMVIVILAVLGAVAIPIFVDLRTEANAAAEQGVVGGVRAGILTFYIDPARGNRASYPATLDAVDASGGAVTCSSATPCFTNVLQQGGITGNWTKQDADTYQGPTGTDYDYTAGTGTFI